MPADQVRGALTFKEGDTISLGGDERRAFLTASENRVAALPGVVRARTRVVCCDQGRAIVYVGVEEAGAPTMQFRAAPLGDARLAPDIVQAGEEFSKALRLAVQRGAAEEDRSEGHAFNRDPAMRAIQERFLVFAKRDLPELRLVLRSSSDAAHRALAAQVLGYATDKQAVVEDLVHGMADPSEEVRNNAMRTLLVFADTVPSVNRSTPAHSIRAVCRVAEFAGLVRPEQGIRGVAGAFSESGSGAARDVAEAGAHAAGGDGALEERGTRPRSVHDRGPTRRLFG